MTAMTDPNFNMNDPNSFSNNINTDAFLNSNNGWIEDSEPEEDPDTIENADSSPGPITDAQPLTIVPPTSPIPPAISQAKVRGAYFDGPNIVPTAFPSMYPTGFYIDNYTGEHMPLPGRDLPTPPEPPIGLITVGTPDAIDWTWLSDVLHKWRDEGDLPIIEGAGSPSVPWVAPYLESNPRYDIPAVISHVSNQDTRMDLMEDALNELPGTDAFEHLKDGVNKISDRVETIVSAFENNAEILGNVRENTINLKERLDNARLPNTEWRLKNIEGRMRGYERRMDQVETSAAGTAAFYAHIYKTGYDPDA